MGCDIHLYVEIKSKGKWLLYNQPGVSRNYSLFAKMANVRNQGGAVTPISEPRGLPEDISEATKVCFDYDEPDAHSMSYLTLIEINRLEKWWKESNSLEKQSFNQVFGWLFGNGYDDLQDLTKPPRVEDVRFVFWFDN